MSSGTAPSLVALNTARATRRGLDEKLPPRDLCASRIKKPFKKPKTGKAKKKLKKNPNLPMSVMPATAYGGRRPKPALLGGFVKTPEQT
jgi:hypothetical protein